jgi:hypothetical protein
MKWFGWVVKTILSTVIVTAVSLAVTWSMVNIYIQQFISPLNAQQALRPVALTDLIAFIVAQGTGSGTRSSVEEPRDAAAGGGGETGALEPAQPAQPAQGEEAPGNVPKETEQEPEPKDALPVMGSVRSAEAGFISADELDEKKDRITPEDREEIFSIMMSRVPPEQLQNISQLLEGGITAEEVNQAAAILKEHLNEQEYEKLIGILMKY